jgi:hypothetical protein
MAANSQSFVRTPAAIVGAQGKVWWTRTKFSTSTTEAMILILIFGNTEARHAGQDP